MRVTRDTQSAPLLLELRVQAGSRRQGVSRGSDGTLRVSVHAAPERGKANRAVLELLAETLGVKRQQLEIVVGVTSKRKSIQISGLSVEEFRARLQQLPQG